MSGWGASLPGALLSTLPHLTQVPPTGVKEMEQASSLHRPGRTVQSSGLPLPKPKEVETRSLTHIPVCLMSPLFSPGVGMGSPCGQGGRCCASESTPQSRALGSVCQECRLVGTRLEKGLGSEASAFPHVSSEEMHLKKFQKNVWISNSNSR